MDQFHEVMIRDKNPQAPGLVDVIKAREVEFTDKMASVFVPPGVKAWAERMSKQYAHVKEYCGNDVIMGHIPVNWVTALMCCRYGQATDFWPETFESPDLERALGWEKGKVDKYARFGERVYLPAPIAGGTELTDYMEAQIGNGLFRTGLTTIAAWAASTSYSLGDIVQAITWNDTLFECVVAGTSAGSEPTWNTGIGVETTDNTATWIAVKVGVVKRSHFIALYTAAPGETGGGTEVSGGAYARVKHDPTDANWTANTQVAGAGRNDNALAITFPTPSANWGTITDTANLTRSTGGNFTMYTPLTTSKTVNNGDPAPNFPVGAFDMDWS